MQGYNVIMIYDPTLRHLLMCKRRKNPYKGLSNLIGGKIEPGEDGLDAAYREMWEETNLCKEDISLLHLMDFTYHLSDCYMEVYVGKLKQVRAVAGEENELFWADLNSNFFDIHQYAGEGNIGHMAEQVKLYAERIFKQ
ncbi:MAG: NUDIX hydrolase [Clostridiales bacterium]|nr:NUDIX hydrolase [Clostridiales bacterium]